MQQNSFSSETPQQTPMRIGKTGHALAADPPVSRGVESTDTTAH